MQEDKQFVVIVCGGRKYADAKHVDQVLLAVLPLFSNREDILLVDGACHLGGADKLAHEWAERMYIATKRYPVDTRLDGPWPGAGGQRNRRMYDDCKPDLVIAFPGDNGTRNMCNYAFKKGCHLLRIT